MTRAGVNDKSQLMRQIEKYAGEAQQGAARRSAPWAQRRFLALRGFMRRAPCLSGDAWAVPCRARCAHLQCASRRPCCPPAWLTPADIFTSRVSNFLRYTPFEVRPALVAWARLPAVGLQLPDVVLRLVDSLPKRFAGPILQRQLSWVRHTPPLAPQTAVSVAQPCLPSAPSPFPSPLTAPTPPNPPLPLPQYFRSPAQLLVHDRPTADPLVLSSPAGLSSSDPDSVASSGSHGLSSDGGMAQAAASLAHSIGSAAVAGSAAADGASPARPTTAAAAAPAAGRSPLSGSAARSAARRRAGQ